MGGRIYINGQVFKDFKEQRIPEDLRQFVLNGGMIGGKKFATIIKRKSPIKKAP